jgi:hypothetical protein
MARPYHKYLRNAKSAFRVGSLEIVTSKLAKWESGREKAERQLSQFCVRRRTQLLIETVLDHRRM